MIDDYTYHLYGDEEYDGCMEGGDYKFKGGIKPQKKIQCKHCGEYPLVWWMEKSTNFKWRLHKEIPCVGGLSTLELHVCKEK